MTTTGMAASLPNFEHFSVFTDEQSAGVRWKKWVAKFENLLCALDIDSDKRKKALLLHYGGEDVYNIVESFSDTKKGIGSTITEGVGPNAITRPNEYTVLKQSLTQYFTPKKNLAYEVLKFRNIRQEPGESIDTFHTRLRTAAALCEFHDVDTEILTQILHGCTSQKIRRRALRDSFTLDQVLAEARAQELSETRARDLELGSTSTTSASANAKKHSCGHGGLDRHSTSSANTDNRRQTRGRGHGGGYQDRNRGKRQGQVCRNCGGKFPHNDGCPAAGKKCNLCSKVGHFARVCRSTQQKVRQIFRSEPAADTSSDESVFHISHSSKIPAIRARIFDAEMPFLVDSGATVNIIHSSTYEQLCPNLSLKNPCPKIQAYGSDKPLPVKGYFTTDISYKQNCARTTFFVVDSEKPTESLLGSDTAQTLGLVQFAFSTKLIAPSIADKYPTLFDGKLGCIQDVKIKLHIDTEVPPVVQQHRRIPFHLRKKVEKELQKLEDQDIIEPVTGPTPWVSPIVCIPKKVEGEIRVCVDMREANKAIGREKHPMPTLDDLIADLNGSTTFSKLDMTKAYHQLELEESSRFITTFSTHVGLRRYKRLLFGVNAASEIFQNAISSLLQGIPGARNLSDDIIVHGKNQEEHDKRLHATLKRLEENGAKLNKEKCIFSTNELKFYGHVFGEKGVSPDPDKIKSITDAPPPQNISELRSFLGMTQYMSRFIPGYASLTEPLRTLTKKSVVWQWTKAQQEAFTKLKKALTGESVMSYFDPDRDTSVLVDASPVGLGAILTQDGKAICYASRALTSVEQRYSQTDREMLAAVYGVEHFQLYLQGAPFTVVTDHKPLLGILKNRSPTTARIERYRLRLMPYDMKLVYRPGRNELNPADFISRHPQTIPTQDNAGEEYIAFLAYSNVPKAMTQEEVRTATQEDTQLQEVMSAIHNGRWDTAPPEFSRFRDELSAHNGLLLRGHRLVIPSSLRQRTINIAHQSHQGIVKTKQCVREKIWFPGIDTMVEETVKGCIPCQASYQGPQQREPLRPTPLPSEPWASLAIDFAGPFPCGNYVMVITDEYSRYPEVEILPSTSEKSVLPRLENIFARQGFPKSVKTDNGPPFNGHAFSEYADQCGFRHAKVTPLWPEANGAAERVVETVKTNIRASVAANQDWKKQLPVFLRTYRATPHSATGVSPFEALNGRKMNIGLPDPPKTPMPTPVHTRIIHNDRHSKQKMAEYTNNRRRTSPSTFTPGDHVLVKQPKRNVLSTPYSPHPYVIIEKKGSMVTAERCGKKITRNSSHFKQVPESQLPVEEDVDQNEWESGSGQADNPSPIPSPYNASVSDKTPIPPGKATPNTGTTPVSRPIRERQKPSYLKDYVLK